METFNIEEYLDSLPDDVEEINISNKGLTYVINDLHIYYINLFPIS
jgi:hypothetical protein